LEIAKLLKGLHPDSKLLFGGYSSTYYHQELIRYPQVDLVMRGDSTEIPMGRLFEALSEAKPLGDVPNLTWKSEGKVTENLMSFVPEDLDFINIDYGWIIRSVIRHRDLEGHKPFKDWDRYPLTVAFTVRGCHQQCQVCGGSCSAMNHFLGRKRAAFRTPEKVAQDIYDIQSYLRAPTFVVGDLRAGGKDYADRFFGEAKRLGIDNPIILELFTPANSKFYEAASSAFASYSIEFSPDSHDEEVRFALGRRFRTASMEKTVQHALDHHCQRFDVFFMIGLPQQTKQSALESAAYSKHLYSLVDNDKRLFVFTSPLAPFLDPGSYAFENPDQMGYKLFARSLEEHRARLLSPSWKYVLSYETKWMTRDEIVDASYDAADILNRTRFDCRLIDKGELEARLERTGMARAMMRDIDTAMEIGSKVERDREFDRLRQKGHELMESTICQKRDLEWESSSVLRSVPRAMLGLVRSKRRRS
jgi:B12-binding domain/radical SAM domain protein